MVSPKWIMVGMRPDCSSHAPFLPSPLRGGRLVGGQKRTWVRPLGVCSLTHACAEGQQGKEDAPRPDATRPDTPHLGLRGRAQAAPLAGPRAPAEGARAAPREGGKRHWRMRAQSPVRGGGMCSLRHLVSLSLPASSGACSPPPLPPRRGEGPLLVAAFTALNSPKGRS